MGRKPIYNEGAMLQIKIFTPSELRHEMQAVARDQDISEAAAWRQAAQMFVNYAKMQAANQPTKHGESPTGLPERLRMTGESWD